MAQVKTTYAAVATQETKCNKAVVDATATCSLHLLRGIYTLSIETKMIEMLIRTVKKVFRPAFKVMRVIAALIR